MKYRVIGWTYYDDCDIEDESCSSAAYHAIIDDIKANGYCFSGYAHQEYFRGVPVLNDGKKRCFSQRGWGGLMAKAHGYFGTMDYTLFAISFSSVDKEEMPPMEKEINAEAIVAETDLDEEIVIEVGREVYQKAEEELLFLDYDIPALRYLDEGDTLTLESEGKRASYRVTDLERGWDYACGTGEMKPIFMDDLHRILYLGSEEEKEKAKDVYANGRGVISVSLTRE